MTPLPALLPLLAMTAASIAAMLLVAARRHHFATASTIGVGCAVGLALLPVAVAAAPVRFTMLLVIDAFGLYYMGLILAASLAVVVLSYSYLQHDEGQHEEYYLLLGLAAVGGLVLASAAHFASFFLGLELLSVSLYGMIAYVRSASRALEAGIKYLILSGTSSAFLMFGMALIYLELGTMEVDLLPAALEQAGSSGMLFLVGFVLIVAALGFKLTLAPFHMWTPDVYEGAPAPATAFVASVSKASVVAVLLRLFVQLDVSRFPSLWLAIALVAVASMVVGNFLALLQQNVKRLLAYSSIAHFGYVLVAFLAAGPLAVEAVSYYLLAYLVTVLAAFGVVTALSSPLVETESLPAYRGLFWRRPYLATIFTLALLSLAGIPITAGFLAKFYVIAAGVDAGLWLLLLVLVANSVVGVYYYLRVIVTMAAAEEPLPVAATFAPPEPEDPKTRPLRIGPPAHVTWSTGLVLTVLAVLLVWLGLYPEPVMRLLSRL